MHSQPSRHEILGYQTALDLGVSALDAGATRAAVDYLSDAVAVRPTRFALVRLAAGLRDQGQLELARDRLLQARALPDGEDPYVIVTLAAVLCDLKDYEGGLAAAQAAVDVDPTNPAALNVAARCVRELAGLLERSPHANRQALLAVRARADDFARRAAEASPEPAGDMLRRRRERAVQAHLLNAHIHASPPSGTPAEERAANDAPPAQTIVAEDGSDETPPRWWRRLLARLIRSDF